MVAVAWIGLGVMGFPMVGHLARKSGCATTVYNRTASKAAEWVAKNGGVSAPTPAHAAKDADIVFACVGNDNDLRSVTIGSDGAFQAKALGIGFIDAPVSGGQAGAENGLLTVMCGGDAEVYAKAEPLIMHYARMSKLLGPAGAGQLAKMCNQIAIAGVVQGLAEAIQFGMKSGLDMNDVIDVISKGAAGSWQMENRHKTMIAGKFDFGFAVDWMRKDLEICLNEARRNGSHLPMTALVDQFYSDVQAAGGKRWDTSSLITRLTKKP
jgi:3-hydroxyisobutyrate dehydrogenase